MKGSVNHYWEPRGPLGVSGQGLQGGRGLAELRVQGVLQAEGRAMERETRTRGGRWGGRGQPRGRLSR